MRAILLCASLLWAASVSASELFPKPAELSADVDFWKRVYTEVDTASGLLHDERDLRVVYEVLRFSAAMSASTRARKVEERKQFYQAILKRLAAGKRSNLTTDETKVLALWPKGVSNATLSQAVYDVRFQLGQSDRFAAGLERSGAWLPYIRRAFAARGLPEELALLPHVESSFNPDAYSKVGAAGMWQFIPSTGQRYLRIDHVLDERLDPYASTDAAVELLALNYSVTGTWPLAITAYNHGAAGMRRAAQGLGTRDITTILRRYQSRTFGFASRNFYVSFLAALEVDRDAARYFPGITRGAERPLITVELPAYIPVSALCEALKLTPERLRAYNLMLMPPVWNGEKRVPAGYALRLPPGTMDAKTAARALAGIPSALRFAAQVPDEYHLVSRGDTLSGIAARYRVSTRELMVRNQLSSSNLIRVGQRLSLPVTGATVPVTTVAAAPVPAEIPTDGKYRVQKGDTLSVIAARHGLTPGALVEINGLRDADRLQVGQLLALTATASGATSQEAAAAVQAGRPSETLVAELEETEPVSPAAAEDAGVVGATTARPAATADPADYEVAADGTIEVQAIETLGHYADWLEVPTQRLRDLNDLSFNQSVVVGRRLKLDFSRVGATRFTERRSAYHRSLQEQFFAQFRIEGTRTERVRAGDTLWSLTSHEPYLPVWLLRQYNPDLDFARLQPGVDVVIPELTPQTKLSDQG
jgi:membrane-bound lytic murein transglycosylase D